jgi:arginine decarboxylase
VNSHERVGSEDWTVEDSKELFGLADWGLDYFSVNQQGELTVRTPDSVKGGASIIELVRGMSERGLQMPVLLRIENLLDAQIAAVNEGFAKAIAEQDYRGVYRGVFPIKVNQQSQIIEEISEFGARFNHGLEAGSKAELLIALSSLEPERGYIICNGYKDEEFITLGLGAQKLGYTIFFVVETPAEIPLLIECSKRSGVRPQLGARVKLASRVGGHWNQTSGDRSIFGLTSNQLIDLVDELKRHDMLDCLRLLHAHLGSQIPNIRDIRGAVMEACRYYVELVREGAPMGNIDLGGGLAVDYQGSRSNSTHSKNYTLEEYCVDVVEVIMSVLDPLEIEHPTIVTESGRALVAYGSILLFNVLDVTRFEAHKLPPTLDSDDEYLVRLAEVLVSLNEDTVQECYNDAVYYRDEIRELFRRGQMSLRDRSLGEDYFLEILQRIRKLDPEYHSGSPESLNLVDYLADIYYGNFSVFQSLPDIWAIDQVFPIVPLHRLNERPTRQAILADITCDCDGKIDRFVVNGELQNVLPLHDLKGEEEYYLGVFLVGAYQETLGDLHNLLGDTHVVSVRLNADGSFHYVKEVEGDSVADVLSYVEYEPRELLKSFRDRAEKGVRSGRITPAERQQLVGLFADGMRGYTYFER